MALVSINTSLSLKDNTENYFYRGHVSEKMKIITRLKPLQQGPQQGWEFSEAYLALRGMRLSLARRKAPWKAVMPCWQRTRQQRRAPRKEPDLCQTTEYPKAIDDIPILIRIPMTGDVFVRGNYYQNFPATECIMTFQSLLVDPGWPRHFKKSLFVWTVGDFKSAIKDYEKLASLHRKTRCTAAPERGKKKVVWAEPRINPTKDQFAWSAGIPWSTLKMPEQKYCLLRAGLPIHVDRHGDDQQNAGRHFSKKRW